jgi:hypothetical protein
MTIHFEIISKPARKGRLAHLPGYSQFEPHPGKSREVQPLSTQNKSPPEKAGFSDSAVSQASGRVRNKCQAAKRADISAFRRVRPDGKSSGEEFFHFAEEVA